MLAVWVQKERSQRVRESGVFRSQGIRESTDTVVPTVRKAGGPRSHGAKELKKFRESGLQRVGESGCQGARASGSQRVRDSEIPDTATDLWLSSPLAFPSHYSIDLVIHKWNTMLHTVLTQSCQSQHARQGNAGCARRLFLTDDYSIIKQL